MFQISSQEFYEDGQVIYEENSHGDWIYVIEFGEVELSRTIDGQRIVLDTLQPGDVFGEVAYLTQERRATTAKAVGKTELGIIDRTFLDEEFNKLTGRFRTLLRGMAAKFQKTTEMLAQEKVRRREPRAPLSFSLAFRDHKSLVKATSLDISGLGVFIKTAKPLDEGTHFNLKLQLPGETEPLRIGCEVAWRRIHTDDPEKSPPGMGVKFIQLNSSDRQKLEEAVAAGKDK
ncbi:MAG: TIGR02266 family protein [Desulfobacterales bacterium]|nr:TIGR02266 family protein [Desulfobacterales bacterium]